MQQADKTLSSGTPVYDGPSEEIERAGQSEGQMVALVGGTDGGMPRGVGPPEAAPFELNDGCVGTCSPEQIL